MNPICKECGGKCCHLIVRVTAKDWIFGDNKYTDKVENYPPEETMKRCEKKCIALKNGKCSIYKKRPRTCFFFEVGSKQCLELRGLSEKT